MPATLLALFAVAAASQPVALKSHIVSASVFKPGLVLIVREVSIPAGKGRYKVDFLPDALDGSFWFGGDGVEINDVQTTLRSVEETVKRKAKSIGEYLAANVGKSVTIVVSKGLPSGGTETVRGTLLESGQYSPYNNSAGVTLQLPNGNLRVVNFGAIAELKTAGLKTTYEVKQSKPVQEITFSANSPKPAKVGFMTLEIGAAWSSSYAVSLVDDGHATVSSKAQLAVGPFKFVDTNVNVVAGLPNLPKVLKFDLADGYGSLQAYLSGTQDAYKKTRPGPGDPLAALPAYYERLRQMQNQQAYYGNRGYGGYGGGGIDYATYDPVDNSLVFAGSNEESSGGREDRGMADRFEAARVEDVFAYPLGKLSMEPGDRLTRMLINDEAAYERVYRWSLGAVKNEKIVKLIRLKNDGKLPWTGGKCLVLKDGMPLAQVDMPFTAPGQEASLELGEAQDIVTDRESREVSRENVSAPYGRTYVAVTVEEKLLITNARPDAVKMEVAYGFTGQVLKAEGATARIVGNRLQSMNVNTDLTWAFDLKPGEKKEITFTWKRVIE